MANIFPLLLGVGAIAVLAGGKKKSKKKACPETVTIRVQDIPHTTVNLEEEGGGTHEINAPTAALNAAANGERDIIKLAKIVATPHIPERCLADPAVRVNIVGRGGEAISMSAPETFFFLAGSMVSDVGLIMKWSEDDMLRGEAAVISWWNQNMSNAPLPKPPS